MAHIARLKKTPILALLLFAGAPFLRAQQPAAAAPKAPPASPQAVSIDDAAEIRMGRVLADKFEQAEGLAPTPQTMHIEAYLQTVGDRIASNAQRRLPYQFHYDPNPTFRSALGLPGGQIFVGAGLLAFIDSEDQLAVVLGHELEHIALNIPRSGRR